MSDFNSNREPVRIFVTGNCDGLEPLRDALAQHEDVELVGSSEHVADAFAPLAGGHLQVVLHGTRDAHLPVHDIASIREHTQAPLILLASGDSSQLLSEALETDVADVLLLPQLADNVVFAVRKAAHAGRRLEAEGGHGRRGRVLTVFSPKGGTGKTVTEPKVNRLLEVARGSYDLIVVDTSPFFHGPMLATLDRTDELLVLCGLDVPTLKNVKLAQHTLDLLSFPASRVRFVLNRSNSKVGMKRG